MLRRFFIPKQHAGVSLISWATSIRWVGWGFVEYLIPIFLFSFVNSYAETGLLRSSYSVMFLLSLPIVGAIANHIRAKYLIIVGLCIYPFIGLSYFLAGALGAAVFIVIARGLNGVSYALDSTGRETYFRRHAAKKKIGTAFGYFETLTSFWWIIAVLVSLILIDLFEMHTLFLLIIPTTLAALLLVMRIPKDTPMKSGRNNWYRFLSWRTYAESLHEVMLWKGKLKRFAFAAFMSGLIFSVTEFFLPIYLYTEGVSLEKIILLMVIYSIPGLFGTPIGKLVDKIGSRTTPLAFMIITALLVALAVADTYQTQLLIVFLLGFAGLLLDLSITTVTTHISPPKRYGTLSSSFAEIGQLSAIVGPVAVGFVIDISSLSFALILLALLGTLPMMLLSFKR